MHMKRRLWFHAALAGMLGGALLGSAPAHADMELGVFGGGKFFSSDGALSRDGLTDQPDSALAHSGIFGLRIGYLPIPRLALEGEIGVSPTSMRGSLLFPDGNQLDAPKVAVFPLRAHLLINILTGRVRPFVLVGGGGHLSAALSPGVVRDDAKGALHAGAGLAFDIRPGWGLRFDGRFLLSQGSSAPLTPEGEVLAAVFGRFGAAPPPPPPPPAIQAPLPPAPGPAVQTPPVPAPVPAQPTAPPPPPAAATPSVPAPAMPAPAPPPVVDTDKDGVLDAVDRCPTQPGPAVNGGCPIAPAPSAVPGPAPNQSPVVLTPAAQDLEAAAQGIEFEPNSATITLGSSKVLDQAVRVLNANPALHMEIGGHTDSSGDPQRNRQISQQRADAVKKYLIDHGIAGDRLRAQGYGADRPIVSNDTPEGRAQNRRVEFTLIPST